MTDAQAQLPYIQLRAITPHSAASLVGGCAPAGLRTADDYPTEFSIEMARSVHDGEPLGPFFVLRTIDQVVIGEIGGTLIGPSTVEIGYAVVRSAQGRGYATLAVRQLVRLARAHPAIDRLIARTPLDRQASERVLIKSGFRCTGEIDDEYENDVLRVREWEYDL